MSTKPQIETVDQAWRRVYGVAFDVRKMECIYFATGFNAGASR